MIRIVGVAMLALLLSSCASTGAGRVSFSFFNTYVSAQKDFDNGRIMEARAKVLAMDKSREDYAKARELLNRKIDPARKRLLKHYSALGERYEKAGEWYKAMQAYEQASSFSLRPKALKKKRQAMELQFRQARMNALLKERRKEDSEWLAHQDDFEPPRGVPVKDEVFLRKLEQFHDALEERSDLAYREARRFLRKGYPAVAYVEIESHLRLDPQSEDGKKLKAEIKAALPKGIKIPAYEVNKKSAASKRVLVPKSVTASQVRALMKKGQWLKAKRYALVYRREGGKGATKLLKQIQTSIANDAEAKFKRGSFFYRKEKLDRALQYWSEAVALEPGNTEYAEALRRAQQLKERLELLRQSNEAEAAAPAKAK
ncbi:MAG: 4-hydroxy-3-methylbut-2-en-1-yl diphosphate synthase [Mariprofundaceae bacterium]